MTAFAPGTVVQRYRLDGVVGVGGMGTVYRATHLDTGASVAVKAMHPAVALKREHQKRFLREARAAMATSHPNIVTIHEVFEHAGAPMLAMELLVGEPMEKLLEREPRLALDRLARILIRVTSAVGTAHSLGIVHRDLKPDNIFLCQGDEGLVKVLDFGIAKLTATQGAAAETAALTRTGALMGTPYYMSPQQAFGEKHIDQRCDIWSIGIILYRCLSGVLPTYGTAFGDVFRRVVSAEFTPIEQLVPGLPVEIATLVRRMLERDPNGRPWDLREVHAVLERHAATSAPAFGVAVAPIFDEITNETNPAAGSQAASALAQAPIQLRGTPHNARAPQPAPATSRPFSGAAEAPHDPSLDATVLAPDARESTAVVGSAGAKAPGWIPVALIAATLSAIAIVAMLLLRR